MRRLESWYDRNDLMRWLFDGGELPEVRPIEPLPWLEGSVMVDLDDPEDRTYVRDSAIVTGGS